MKPRIKHDHVASRPLKIITLNTQNSYIFNTALLGVLADAGLQLKWLEEQLQQAEAEGTPVWLLGHIPPSMSESTRKVSLRMFALIERY